MVKQTIIPENAVSWVFRGAPHLALASSFILLIYILLPYLFFLVGTESFFSTSGDIIVIVYLLMIPAIALIAGGFASGSPYSAVGAQREVVLLMSVEVPLAIIVITFAWKISQTGMGDNPFSLAAIAATPLWSGMGPMGIIGGILLVMTFMAIIPAEIAKIPFDQAEAETEIADGLMAEYSGKYLALYGIADAVKALAITSLFVILFFPQGLTALTGLNVFFLDHEVTIIFDMVFFVFKIFIVYVVTITTVRVAVARLKISQAARLFIITMSMLSLAGYLLIYLDPRITGL